MQKNLKPIQTRYKGYRFRSRLEARWAVFFDALGLRWEYEPEGFHTPAGQYLPDFFMQGNGHYGPYIEVKPTAPSQVETDKLCALCEGQTAYGIFLCGSPGDERAISVHKDGFVYEQFGLKTWLNFVPPAFSDSKFISGYDAAVVAARSARFEHGERG